MKVPNCLRSIVNDKIMLKNTFPLINYKLQLDEQVNFVQDSVENTIIGRNEVRQVISWIGQEYYYFQAENHLDYFFLDRRMPNLKRGG